MKPACALLVLLSLSINSTDIHAQTSNGTTSLATQILFGAEEGCTMTDLAVELLNDRIATCAQGQSHFFNGERRSVNSGLGIYPLDGEHIQNGYELTSCACSQNGTWTRTMSTVTVAHSSYIRWTWKFYARKSDCSLELKRDLTEFGCWATFENECECGEGETAFIDQNGVCNCNPSSPIVIDLDGDGVRFTSRARGVDFDFDGDGIRGRIPWPKGDGWLVLDEREDGMILDGRQLFGDQSPQRPSLQPNGYEALRVFDDDNNGRINSRDGIWSLLAVWQDLNHNGLSELGEVRSLDDLGIRSLSLNYHQSPRIDRHGNEFRYRSRVRWANGTRTSSWDVFFGVS